MKILIIVFFLFLSVNALSQSNDTSYQKSTFRLGPDIRTVNNSKFLYIVDDKTYCVNHIKKRLAPDTSKILEVSVLKGANASAIYGSKGVNGAVVVITKKFATKEYQKKLSAFSEDYKKYIALNKNDDSDLVYLLNGVVLNGKPSEVIKTLYNEIEKLKTVDFIDQFSKKLNLNNPKPIVVITTTKQ
jgi:TonB-dependent SusC/RagA subfamily outer membrane receptor